MKKCLYYLSPLIITPSILLLCEMFDNLNIITMSPIILILLMLVYSISIGVNSPSCKKIDLLISLIMPLSLFLTMFIGGFLDYSETYQRFSIYRGLKTSLAGIAIIFYIFISITTFISSSSLVRRKKSYSSKE